MKELEMGKYFDKGGLQSYKIFLDRYTLKAPNGQLDVGDLVLVVTKKDPKFPQKEIGTVKEVVGQGAIVDLFNGEEIYQDFDLISKPMETTPEQVTERVANAMVQKENKYSQRDIAIRYSQILFDYFLPGGRILAGAGVDGLTLSNCFVLPDPEDSRMGVFERAKEMTECHSRGGGVGINLSSLRPRYSHVAGVNGHSSGAVSWGEIFNLATGLVEQGGSRRGATMVMINDWHPDVFEFIEAKRHAGKYENTNMSVCISNAFMDAVERDDYWNLVFPDTSHPQYDEIWDGNIATWQTQGLPVKVYKTIKAKDIWSLLIESAWASAEPGLHFLERSNEMSNSWYLPQGELRATNPCVSGDAWVATVDGPRMAKDIENTPTTILVDGKLYETTGTFVTGIKDLYSLKTAEGWELKMTADHKVLLDTDDWVEAQDLLPGDRIVLNNHSTCVQWDGIGGSYEDGYLLGLLWADGHIKEDTAVISVWDNYSLNRWVSTLLGSNGSFISDRNETRYKSKKLKELAEFCGMVQGNKKIGPSLEMMSSIFYTGFLQGAFDGDGHVEGNPEKSISVRLSQSDKMELQKIQRMLLRLGIVSRIYKGKDAGTALLPDGRGDKKEYNTKAAYRLVISNYNAEIFMNDIGFVDEAKQIKLETLAAQLVRGFYKKANIATFVDLEYDSTDVVYDLTNPIIHAFDANGLYVHNCAEQPLEPYGVCNLGAIDLSKLVEDQNVDWSTLKAVVHHAVRFLDAVIDNNTYPLAKIEETHKANRRIGLGTMGLGEMLVKMKIRYGSDESLEFIDRLYQFIAVEAYQASINLAKIYGPFKGFDPDLHLRSGFISGMPEHIRSQIKEFGIRNVCLLTQAPTGTTGTMAGTSTGIEPYFSWQYTRTSRLGVHLETVPVIKELNLDINNLPEYCVTAQDLSPSDHVRVQAAIQRWTDSAISKTANAPSSYSIEDTDRLYRQAYAEGCKGVTIYRDQSRHEQVLEVVPHETAANVIVENQGGCEITYLPDGSVFSKCD